MKNRVQEKTAVLQRMRGLTFIELLIVVTIIALLVAFAYPMYTNYAQKARRTQATTALLAAAQDQEKWFNANNAYSANASPFTGAATVDTDGGFYRISAAVVGTLLTLTATAQGPQAADTECATITLTSRGVKAPAVCWR